MNGAKDLRFPECSIGASVFLLLSLWCLVLLFDVRYVDRLATFPDGEVGTIGIDEACFALGSLFFFNGVVPWVSVYRGLSLLLTHRQSSEEAAPDGVRRAEN